MIYDGSGNARRREWIYDGSERARRREWIYGSGRAIRRGRNKFIIRSKKRTRTGHEPIFIRRCEIFYSHFFAGPCGTRYRGANRKTTRRSIWSILDYWDFPCRRSRNWLRNGTRVHCVNLFNRWCWGWYRSKYDTRISWIDLLYRRSRNWLRN